MTKTVLMVDDEPGIATLVSLCLDPLGVSVVQAADLSAALRAAHRDHISLVLLDLALGGEDGLEILPDLRRDPSLFGVPVIVCSAHDSRRQEALDSGVESFLARPFDTADLRSTVERYLNPTPAP